MLIDTKIIIKLLLLILFCLNIFSAKAQVNKADDTLAPIMVKGKNTISFRVCDVKIASELLDEIPYNNVLGKLVNREIESYSTYYEKKLVVSTYNNGFMSALFYAYAQHRPMIISPDMIWLIICQNFTIHVNLRPEEFRDQLVKHKDKKKILVERNDFIKGRQNPWNLAFPLFADAARNDMKDDIYNLIVADFSTTQDAERLAYQITLMESMKNYFEADLWTGCGIPSITLEGSTADWQWIRKNVVQFKKYNMEKWVDNLIPILDQFVAASQGKIDKLFWQDIYKYTDNYMDSYINGWIVKFFLYIQKHYQEVKDKQDIAYTKYEINPYFDGDKYKEAKLIDPEFPSGLSKFSFDWKYEVNKNDKKTFEMEMQAGFVAIEQNSKTYALKPIISWLLIDKNAKKIDIYGK